MNFWQQPRKPFVGLAFCAACGTIAADFCKVDPLPLLAPLGLIGAIALGWRRPLLVWILVAGAFFILHELNFHHAPGAELAQLLGSARRVVRASGIVIDEPAINPDRPARFTMRLD